VKEAQGQGTGGASGPASAEASGAEPPSVPGAFRFS
jgi:hypothetical protein